MSMHQPHHRALARSCVAAIALTAAPLAAQTPAVGGFVRAAEPAGDHVRLSADQVRAELVAHHAAVVAGTSDDNTVTIILSSSGDYVTSGTSTEATPVLRAAAATGAVAGGVVAASGGSAAAGPIARARLVPDTAPAEPHFMTFAGVGTVDASLVKEIYSRAYAAGEVSANAIRVRLVILKGTSMK